MAGFNEPGFGLDFQRTFNFDVILPNMSGIPGIIIGRYCQSIKFGRYNLEDIRKIRYGAFKRGYLGNWDIESVVATFLVPIPDLVEQYFSNWRGLMTNKDGLYYSKSHYAQTMYIVLWERNSIPSNVYTLSGVFPKNFPAHELSSGNEDIERYSIEFNVDRVEENGLTNLFGLI